MAYFFVDEIRPVFFISSSETLIEPSQYFSTVHEYLRMPLLNFNTSTTDDVFVCLSDCFPDHLGGTPAFFATLSAFDQCLMVQ